MGGILDVLKGVVNAATTAAGIGPVLSGGNAPGQVTVTPQYTLKDSIPYDFINAAGVPKWRWPRTTGQIYDTAAAMSAAIAAAIKAGTLVSNGPTSNPLVPNPAINTTVQPGPGGSIQSGLSKALPWIALGVVGYFGYKALKRRGR
jgi:hypothetical protein